MSGTSYGTVVLHCAPEAAVGGPLALVRDGDLIRLDVEQRRIDLLVDDAELARRRAAFSAPVTPARGWRRLHVDTVLQANLGADLAFLSLPPRTDAGGPIDPDELSVGGAPAAWQEQAQNMTGPGRGDHL
jgi:hypothetical protein